MARKLSTREAVLFGLLVAAGAGYFWYRSGSAERARTGEISEGKPVVLPAAPSVRTDLLARAAETYASGGRDLFQYSQRPPSAAEVRRMREEADRRRREAEEAARRAAEEAARRQKEQAEAAQQAALHPQPPPPPQPPPITMRYLGYLGPKDGKIAVFEDGKDLVLARRGEVVKEQFRVVDIKWETVVMGFVRPEFKGQTRELAMVRK